jgi:GNAT superfamily N-acetyltransferase
MSESDLDIRPFDPLAASDADLSALYALEVALFQEGHPEVPPVSLEAFAKDMRRVWPRSKTSHWVARQTAEVIGWARLDISTTETNARSAGLWIGVQSELRRRGLGRALLSRAAGIAEETGQTELVVWTSSHAPAGGAFVQRIGGDVSVEHQDSALDVLDVDRAFLNDGLARGATLAREYELVTNEGPWPDAGIETVCLMYEIMNTAPHQAVFDPEPTTPADIRLRESFQATAGIKRWTMYVRPAGSETIAGFTEVYWRPDAPTFIEQGDTGIAPEHRGKGLAVWLKASMLAKILRERPGVQRIQTGNATTNAPMLSINQRLGFKPTHSAFMWQAPLESVLSYLAGKS